MQERKDSRLQQGLQAYRSGRIDAALEAWQKASDEDPYAVEAILYLAALLADVGCYEAAQTAYQKLRELPLLHAGLYEKLCDSARERARLFEELGDLQAAEEELQRGLLRARDPLPLLLELARVYMHHNKLDLALATFHKAFAIDPQNKEVLFFGGLLHYRKRDYAKTRHYFEKAALLGDTSTLAASYLELCSMPAPVHS